jgi:hypothetical protein
MEQAEYLKNLNKNIHVILDDQSEMIIEANEGFKSRSESNSNYIFWEGLGYTLKHFESAAYEIEDFMLENQYRLKLLTTMSFKRWGGYLGNIKTEDVVRHYFPRAWRNVEIIPWTVEATKEAAKKSEFGIIPISKNDNFAMLKPENKLISMWAMGLPVICSPTFAYSRVANEIDAGEMLCQGNWTSKLNWISKDMSERRRLREEGSAYFQTFCTKEQLQAKWRKAINSVLV